MQQEQEGGAGQIGHGVTQRAAERAALRDRGQEADPGSRRRRPEPPPRGQPFEAAGAWKRSTAKSTPAARASMRKCVRHCTRTSLTPFATARPRSASDATSTATRTATRGADRAPPTGEQREQDGEQQVEVLFDGERPQMLQRGAGVVLHVQSVLPEIRRHRVVPDDRVHGQEDVEHRPEPQHPPRGEPSSVEPTRPGPLPQDELSIRKPLSTKNRSTPAQPNWCPGHCRASSTALPLGAG